MTNLIKNGTFADLGEHWTGTSVTYANGQANVSRVGHIQQIVTLSSAIPAGTTATVSFDVSGMYGSSITVNLNGKSYPSTNQEGHHVIAFVVSDASDTLTLRFVASNAFTLDNVEMTADSECIPVDVIKNGDFADLGEHWAGTSVTYANGQANVSRVGHIQQIVTLSSAIPAGTTATVSFDVSGMYGSSVTVNLNGKSYPSINQEGHHVIAFVVSDASDTLTLRFVASNAFTLDNVKLLICM